MTERIDREGFSTPAFEEDESTTELFEAPPKDAVARLAEQGRALYDDVVELGRSVYDTAKDAQSAVDLEGNIEKLGPGDSLKLKAAGQVRAGVGGTMGETLEVKRGADGRYTVSGSAELGIVLSQKLEVGTKALQSMGLEQVGGARVELACDSAEEAAQAARALRNTQLRQLGVPVGEASEELKVLLKTASAIEVGARVGANADGGFAELELRGSAKAETSVRYELKKNELVLKTSVSGEGGAPLKLKGIVPQTTLGFGQALKAGVKLESETRFALGAELGSARSRLTISSETREAAGTIAAGHEAKVTLDLTASQAKAALEALANNDAAKLAPLLEVKVSTEARAFEEKGGELNLGLSAGAVGGFVALEAKLRDVDDAGAQRKNATLGEALAWITSS